MSGPEGSLGSGGEQGQSGFRGDQGRQVVLLNEDQMNQVREIVAPLKDRIAALEAWKSDMEANGPRSGGGS